MTTPWHEITAWPFVVPLATLGWVVLLLTLHRRAGLTLPRALLAGFLCVYGAGIVAYTVFPVVLGRAPSELPWWEGLNVVPLADAEIRDVLKNVVVFLPVGFLVPLVLRAHSVRRVLGWGLALSLAIETTQVVQAALAHGGHAGDVNDLLANVVGAPIGYALFRAALHVPVLARLAAAATWPARPALEPRDRRLGASSAAGPSFDAGAQPPTSTTRFW